MKKTFDVSLTGRSTEYRGVAAEEFLRKLVTGSFPEPATVRMKQPNKPGAVGNGWLIRHMNIDPALTELIGGTGDGTPTLESLDAQLERDITVAGVATPAELEKIKSSYPKIPERVTVTTTAFRRNPAVVIEALQRADGFCEGCGRAAPFKRRSDGSPYLEVHHIVTLANGGEDTTENAVALCPNCHRQRHHG